MNLMSAPENPSRRAFLAGTTAAIATLGDLSSAEKPKIALPSRGLCAHRGVMATHPENTLPAFEEAVRLGAHMIEFDVQLTRDGALVLMHDATIDRTTDRQGLVSDQTLSDLRRADAGIRHGARFAGTRIPTLEEALAGMPRNVWLNCHLKGGADLGAATARAIAGAGRLHQAFLAANTAAARAARETVTGILICNMERQADTAEYARQTIAMRADFIQLLGKGEVDPAVVAGLLAAGVRVNYYHDETPEGLRRLFAAGVQFPLVNDFAPALRAARELGVEPWKAA